MSNMNSPRKGSLEVPSLQFPDSSLRNQSIISLDGFRSPSPLPSSPGAGSGTGIPGDQDILYELAETVQIDGAKAVIAGNVQRVKEIVRNLKRNSCQYLIDLATEEDGYNMLHFAVCYKRLQIVKFLIENGANVECTTKDDQNDTPLMLAIRYNDSFTMKHLEAASTLERGETSASIISFLLNHANFNADNASGTTPLSLAVQKQNETITKLLLQNTNVIVNKHNLQGYSPLHFACAGENVNIVAMLLGRGADMFTKTDKGYIPLHVACRRGRGEILELLIQKCPDEDKKRLFEVKDNFGNSALLLAKEAPNSDVFTTLQTKHNLSIHSKNNNHDGIFHKFAKEDDGMLNAELLTKEECVRMLKESNLKRETPLHIACQLGHWKSIILFIEKGASISVKNATGNTPLMTAIIAGKIEVLLHMLKAINEFEKMSFRDILLLDAKNNKTLLNWAIEGNHTVLIEAVVQLDLHLATESDPNNGKAIMHIAAASGSLSIIKVLLNSKHIVELLHLTDSRGKTPLMLAAEYGHIECVKVLHVPGAKVDSTDGNEQEQEQESDLNIVDHDGHTAFHLACLNGHFPVVDYLCKCGTDLEACEGEDGTPLACAAGKGHVKIVNYLLGHDVDINGGITETPLLVASRNGHEKCVKQLLQRPHIDVTIRDEDGHNCLALAALHRQLQTALAIINSPYWQEALKGCDKHSATPLRLLIKYLPDAAEVVLFRCINQIKNDKEEVTAIEMSFEFLDDFQDPVEGGINGLLHTVFSNSGANGTLGSQTVDPSLWKHTSSPIKFNRHNHVLQWMVKYERTSLLQHPVTRELVSYKWKAYAMPAFLLNLAIYLIFLAFLTAFAVVIPLPNEEPLCRGGTIDCTKDPDSSQVFLRFAATLLLVYCGVRSVTELLQLVQRRLAYLTEPENYMEVLLIISTVIFTIAAQAQDCFCLRGFAWQFGALAVFLAWIDLVLYLKKLPLTGIPINMLQSVVVTFLRLIYLPAILIIAFAIPFYMLFSRPEFENSFDTPGFSLMKSLVMTSGEMEYEQVFRFRDFDDATDNTTAVVGDINYITMSHVLFVIFIILMPVLFANLLIGLAVGDTQKVEEKATLTYLSLQVSLALEIEEKLPWFRRKLKKTLYRVEKYLNLPTYFIWYPKLIHSIFGNSFKELEKDVHDLQSEDKLISLLQGLEVLEPIDDVKAQVQINTNTMVEIKNVLDILKKESTEAIERDNIILKAIKDLKEDLRRKSSPGSTYSYHRPNVSKIIKEFVVKFEGTGEEDQSEA